MGKNLKMAPYFRKNKPYRRWKRDYSSRHEVPASNDRAAASIRNINAENGHPARIFSDTTENKFNFRPVAEHGAVIPEASFRTKQNGYSSNRNLQQYRHVLGNKITVTFNTKINSECDISGESVKDPVHVGAKDKSPQDNTGNYGCIIPNVRSLLAGDMSLKQSHKNAGTESFKNASHGKNFLMPGSNRNEDCFDQTNQIKPDTGGTRTTHQLKRKSTNYSCGPPAKRPRLNSHTDSARYSEMSLRENCSSELPRMNFRFCLEPGESDFGLEQPSTILNSFKQSSVPLESSSFYEKRSSPLFCTVASVVAQSIDPSSQTTSSLLGTQSVPSLKELGNDIRVTQPSKSQSIQRLDKVALPSTIANCELGGKQEVSGATQLLASRTEQDGTDIDEELLLGYDEDDMSVCSETEERVLLQIDDILND
jgi:uncharacterized Fe-S cluster protein YjdI